MDTRGDTKEETDLKKGKVIKMPITERVPRDPALAIRPTVGPTPTPVPTTSPAKGSTVEGFDPADFPGRYVSEVPGLDPEYTRCLTESGVGSLAALASATATDVARILSISEVRAMSFIDEARRLLRGGSGK